MADAPEQAAERDQAEERQLALLVTGALDYAIFMLDIDGHVRTWNPGAERMKGYTRDEIVGRHFSTFYTEVDIERDHPAHELELAIRNGRYEEEGWRVRKDGTQFWANVVITALRDETGELVGFGKVSRDLTARRLIEEQTRTKALELEAANRQLGEFRRLVASVRDYAIFMLDPAGHILSWNTGAQHLKGYAPEDIIGRHFSVFYTAEDRARDHPGFELATAIRQGRYEEEGWRVRQDGTMFWASVTITAVRDEEGRLTGFAKVTRDLTSRKRSEEALQQAVEDLRAANRELDRFASVAAHDLTDPLRTISGFAELLCRPQTTPEETAQFAGYIQASSTRLAGMLDGLLAYARAGKTGSMTAAVELGPLAHHVLEDLGSVIQDLGAQVEVDIPPEAAVLAAEADVRTVLQNLVSNAVKFADPARPRVAVTAERDEGAWRVAVIDNGRGVSQRDQERIFDAFERAESGSDRAGYGLGLAICQRVLERYGGGLEVQSAPGEGSRFWFTLPGAE